MPFISSIRKKVDRPDINLDHFEITGGDEIYTAGGYRIHVFTKTGESNLIVSPKFPNSDMRYLSSQFKLEYLVIAGGGGGATNLAGGGGAGGYKEGAIRVPFASTNPTSVGSGGSPSAPGSRYAQGNNGGGSTLSFPDIPASVPTTGGGGGGRYPRVGANPGGSGGGGGGGPSHHGGGGGGGAGTRGQECPLPGPSGGAYGNGTVGQGHPGGRGSGNIHTAGQGGQGLSSTITGSNVVRGGGGGGSGYPNGNPARKGHLGGAGGGGIGRSTNDNANGGVGSTNTGGGGGGGSHYGRHGGGGGPGLIVVRYNYTGGLV